MEEVLGRLELALVERSVRIRDLAGQSRTRRVGLAQPHPGYADMAKQTQVDAGIGQALLRALLSQCLPQGLGDPARLLQGFAQ